MEEQFLLVGTKCDLESQRQVRKEKGLELAQQYGLSFVETSALENKNVHNAF